MKQCELLVETLSIATMAQFTDLPEEVIVMIVRRLDFGSLCSMYNSCKFFRNILSMYGVVLECNMSLNLVATVNTLRLDFFKAISNHLLLLNMRGVPDLSKTKVLPAFNKLKRLKVLDISYTSLTMFDLIAIHNICPTIKDITVNLKLSHHREAVVSKERMQQYQMLFANFENVHFVGALSNLLHFKFVSHILKNSKLDTLKYSAVEYGVPPSIDIDEHCGIPHFNHLAAYLINWRQTITTQYPDFSIIELKKYEFIVITTLNLNYVQNPVSSVFATPLFKKFFKEHFNVDAECVTNLKRNFTGNIALLVWNKETMQLDDIFFHKLYNHVKPYFPFYYDGLSDISCPQSYDWIFSEPRTSDEVVPIEDNENGNKEKRRKTAIPNSILDYDNLLKDKLKVQLSLVFKSQKIMSVSLPSNGQYLCRITFLSLSGGAVKYNTGFFSNLFQGCHNLVTLSVECPTLAASRYSYDIVHAIKASQTMKNLRLVDKGMHFKQFFDSLSQCKTLENIHLVDLKQWDQCQIADPTLLIESCAKLYSIFIEAHFAETSQSKQLQWFNKVKSSLNRPYLRVVINRGHPNSVYNYLYDPFVDVFKLNSIKLT